MKRGQITLFLMLGIMLIVFAGLFFYASDQLRSKVQVRAVEASSAKELVEHCLGLVAEDALITVGRQGGVAQLSNQYFVPLNTSYLFDQGEDKTPDSTAVERELSGYIEQHIGACIGNYQVLEQKGITVVQTALPKVTTTIAIKDVQFAIDLPLEEHKGDMTTTPSFVPARKDVRLGEMLRLAGDLVESEKYNNGFFDLDVPCGLDVTHFPLEKTLITVITDKSFLMQNQPFHFAFAHRR
jgi:hypothetical protein